MVYPSITRLLLLVLGLCVLCRGDLIAQNRPLERAEREREEILDDDPLRQSRGSVKDQREDIRKRWVTRNDDDVLRGDSVACRAPRKRRLRSPVMF